jgi:hypothetical protein
LELCFSAGSTHESGERALQVGDSDSGRLLAEKN